MCLSCPCDFYSCHNYTQRERGGGVDNHTVTDHACHIPSCYVSTSRTQVTPNMAMQQQPAVPVHLRKHADQSKLDPSTSGWQPPGSPGGCRTPSMKAVTLEQGQIRYPGAEKAGSLLLMFPWCIRCCSEQKPVTMTACLQADDACSYERKLQQVEHPSKGRQWMDVF